MKEIDDNEIKTLQVDILSKVHDFCMSRDINYSLAFGSLIGAVRHQGYIPWDDDLDIMMPRPDYERFIREFNGYYDDYKVCSTELDLNFDYSYAQIFDMRTVLIEKSMIHHYGFGVKIDLFPVDGTPLALDEHIEKSWRIRMLMSYNYYKLYYLPFFFKMNIFDAVKVCCHKIQASFTSFARNNDRIIKLLKENVYNSSEFVDVYLCPYSIKDTRVPRSIFDSYISARFEDKEFLIISDYDVLLTKIYGDYLVLPSEDKRVCPHCFEAFWKE